jgi:hypothetical protein
MKEESSINSSAVPDESDTDVFSLLQKMQQQLLLLERKLDLLLSQSKGKPFGEAASQDRSFQKRHFSKPFRSFGNPQRHGRGEHGHVPREGDSAQGHFYEHRPREKSRRPNPNKKTFSHNRKERE